jgi:AraC family transcriptional regulator of adaptative response/methylated-DNA-[protein]-cysteine methyltransferase
LAATIGSSAREVTPIVVDDADANASGCSAIVCLARTSREKAEECRVQGDYERVRDAITYIADNAENQPTLDEVAAHVGLSPSHFQRLFRRWAGVSPKRFLQHVTATRAKALLRDSRPVLDTAFEVGLSGSGRLHDLIVTTEAMTPGEYRRQGGGLEIRYGSGETPFGRCFVAATERGICSLQFLEPQNDLEALARVEREWPKASLVRDVTSASELIAEVFGPVDSAGLAPLHLMGTNFQLKVWEALLRVPEGCVISYGDLAERIGQPAATRAVANAVGANPVAYLIPCHRVLRASGELGGYRWGTDRKLVMLERELEATAVR